MARLDLTKYDIQMDPTAFKDLLAELYHAHYRAWSNPDQLVIRPREAMRYTDWVREALFFRGEEYAFDLPDDVILQTLLNIRKASA